MKVYVYRTNRKVKISPHIVNLKHNPERTKWINLKDILFNRILKYAK